MRRHGEPARGCLRGSNVPTRAALGCLSTTHDSRRTRPLLVARAKVLGHMGAFLRKFHCFDCSLRQTRALEQMRTQPQHRRTRRAHLKLPTCGLPRRRISMSCSMSAAAGPGSGGTRFCSPAASSCAGGTSVRLHVPCNVRPQPPLHARAETRCIVRRHAGSTARRGAAWSATSMATRDRTTAAHRASLRWL